MHRDGSDNGDTITLRTPEFFRFEESMVYLTRSNNECLYVVKENSLYKLLSIHGELILISITSTKEHELTIHFLNTTPDKHTREAVVEYVQDWFDFHTDLTPFYQIAEHDSLLQNLVLRYRGLRLIGIPDLFEALCWAIIGQQINLTFAYTLKKRFVQTYGDYLDWNGEPHWLFPEPERISTLSVNDLKQLQFSEKKAEYILEVAKHMQAGLLSKKLLQEMGFREVEEWLVKIRGIGPWTANYVLMRCLRDPSAFPIADVGLHNALKQQLQLDRKPTIPEIREMSKTWRNWEAYATFYLWRSLYE